MHCLNLEPEGYPTGSQALEALPMEAFDDFISSYIQGQTTPDCSDAIEIDSDVATSSFSTGPSCTSYEGTAHSDGDFNHSGSNRSRNGKCACERKAMLTHEDVCINVLWRIRKITKSQSKEARGSEITTSTVAEMLQCIKRTTRSNEELLGCHISCQRQGFMILIIMMCEIMLDGLEGLLQQLRHEDLSGGTKHDEHNSHMQTLIMPKAPLATEPPSSFLNMHSSNDHHGMVANDSALRSLETRSRGGRDKERTRMNVADMQQPTFHKSPWILDEEDELRVIHSLIVARIDSLSGFIKKLREFGYRNQQQVCEEVVGDLYGRLLRLYSRLTSDNYLKDRF